MIWREQALLVFHWTLESALRSYAFIILGRERTLSPPETTQTLIDPSRLAGVRYGL